MKVGAAVVMQSLQGGGGGADRRVYESEIKLADLVEPLGFDSLWSTEHHFSDYMIVPDVIQLMTFMAARTKRIQLGSAVVVLPWHDPIRVAEQILMLDALSGGRAVVGIGRGSGALEFAGLRVPMDESRERFEEGAVVLKQALRGEPFSHHGRFFDFPEVTVRPRPSSPSSFDDRIFGAAVSPGSAEKVAKMGVGMFIIPQRPWDETAADARVFAQTRAALGLAPLAPTVLCWVYCAATDAEAEAGAREHMGTYWASADRHYGLSAGDHKNVKGYEFFAQVGGVMRSSSESDQTDAYLRFHVVGSPATCLDKIRFIEKLVGNDHFIGVFAYGGMPHSLVEQNMRLFAADVMPQLQQRPR